MGPLKRCFKRTVAGDFLTFFSRIYSILGPDFKARRFQFFPVFVKIFKKTFASAVSKTALRSTLALPETALGVGSSTVRRQR